VKPPLLPGFLMAGFECSTPINRDRRRVDELALTQHDRYVREDYRLLRDHHLTVARDGIRWHLIDRHGRHDFASALPFVEAAEAEGITVIWDLFHYGYPDDLDPFHPDFINRFADYCYAFARLIARRSDAIPFYTPVNEMSYFAWAGGDEGMFAPYLTGRGSELKRLLARTSIAGMNAILCVDSRARFVHCEPITRVVAPHDAPHLQDEADYFNYHFVHEAWDLIGGIKEPELGGTPRHLDLLGINYYGHNQWEHQRPMNILAPDDPRRLSFSELLLMLHNRYRRPLIVTETSSHGDYRASWLREIGEECLTALKLGVDLHGLCLYPILDMFDWHTPYDRQPLRMGLWELCEVEDSDCLERHAHTPTLEELNRLKKRFERALPTSTQAMSFAPGLHK
jgi:beta-glucosidase/6-phospho-beta-glucosidase/beta-galactosidase